ncbi:hypothetical protein LKL35_34880 [Streptomyces sp. ET3-23]|uniref:hypothetical protein n=1 Tax=Streptomyces sp. ET3-23 TaxID=2885643 RepID=UPI001D10755F|nr:hypothetical protein [Streptomyces sp. ET3-23]MCC2280552.1 hypothetical protein [Streptomyces sp. ET3-23]
MQLMTGDIDPYDAYEAQRNYDRFRGERVVSIPGVIRVRCGGEWDAVRVPPELGQQALKELGPDIGPVLASNYARQWTFFIDRGSADWWDLRAHGVRLLRRDTVIELPLTVSRARTRDVRWVVPPGDWSDPQQLYRAFGGRADPPAACVSPGRRKPAAKKSAAGTSGAAS